MAPAMAQKSEQEQVLQQAAEAAPAVPEGQPESSVASSYDVTDFGGYEAGAGQERGWLHGRAFQEHHVLPHRPAVQGWLALPHCGSNLSLPDAFLA